MERGSYIIEAICLTLAVIPCLFTVSCNSGEVNKSQDNPVSSELYVTTVSDTDTRNSGVQDGSYCGRVYKDQLFVESDDGKQYLNVGIWLTDNDKYEGLGSFGFPTVYYTAEEIKGLNVGDEFVFDDDIRFTIESLEETDWEYMYNFKKGFPVPNGKILLNKDFCLVHGELYTDTNDNIIDDTKAKKWRLTTDKFVLHDFYMSPVNEKRLFELSDDCVFKVNEWNVGTRTISKDEIEKRAFKKGDSIYSKYASAYLVVRNNKVFEVTFNVEEF